MSGNHPPFPWTGNACRRTIPAALRAHTSAQITACNYEKCYYEPVANFYHAVYRLVRAIPPGRVMTYGQIAAILGQPRAARAVGYAMRACPPDVPWQRVINRHGGISPGGEPDRAVMQRERLEEEGVRFAGDDTCDLRVYRWEPENPEDYFFDTARDFPF